MPFSLQNERTLSSLRITRLTISGKITEEEATDLMTKLGREGGFGGIPLLVISDPSTDIGAGARRIFTAQADATQPVMPTAVVTKSAVMRVTVNFIGRVNGNQNTKMFATEAEAVRWLEETCAPATAAKGTGA